MTKGNQKKPAVGGKLQQAGASHLLKGERVSFDDKDTAKKVSDEDLNSRYAKGEMRIVTEQARYPLAGILAMLKEEVEGKDGRMEPRYKLDPEYQRRHRWSEERKSRLIESFLMNVPVPPVFLFERELARFEVMDGRQRLTALSDFYADKFKLSGLEQWAELNGRKYSELPTKIQDGINRRYISSIILLKETGGDETKAAELKKMIFERLNSGGVKLGSQETRNAVHGGPLNKLCLQLSENENFRRMWGIPLDPSPVEKNADEEDNDEAVDESTKAGERMFKSMEDVELVLRFFAYRQITPKFNLNKISEFLDRFISEGNSFPVAVLDQYKKMFEATVAFLWEALGTESFTVLDSSKKRPTKIVYDPLMFVANSAEVIQHRARLVAKKEVLRAALESTYRTYADLFSGRRTNFQDTQDRNRRVSEAFRAAIAKTKT